MADEYRRRSSGWAMRRGDLLERPLQQPQHLGLGNCAKTRVDTDLRIPTGDMKSSQFVLAGGTAVKVLHRVMPDAPAKALPGDSGTKRLDERYRLATGKSAISSQSGRSTKLFSTPIIHANPHPHKYLTQFRMDLNINGRTYEPNTDNISRAPQLPSQTDYEALAIWTAGRTRGYGQPRSLTREGYGHG